MARNQHSNDDVIVESSGDRSGWDRDQVLIEGSGPMQHQHASQPYGNTHLQPKFNPRYPDLESLSRQYGQKTPQNGLDDEDAQIVEGCIH